MRSFLTQISFIKISCFPPTFSLSFVFLIYLSELIEKAYFQGWLLILLLIFHLKKNVFSIRIAIFTLSNLNFLTIFGFLPQCAASRKMIYWPFWICYRNTMYRIKLLRVGKILRDASLWTNDSGGNKKCNNEL